MVQNAHMHCTYCILKSCSLLYIRYKRLHDSEYYCILNIQNILYSEYYCTLGWRGRRRQTYKMMNAAKTEHKISFFKKPTSPYSEWLGKLAEAK